MGQHGEAYGGPDRFRVFTSHFSAAVLRRGSLDQAEHAGADPVPTKARRVAWRAVYHAQVSNDGLRRRTAEEGAGTIQRNVRPCVQSDKRPARDSHWAALAADEFRRMAPAL